MPETLLQDIRYAVRSLRTSPTFTIVALLTLAVGIGANTAIFSFVDGVLLKPLPYTNADRIMRVLEKPPGAPDARNGISTLNFLDWQRQNTSFEFLAARTGGSVTLTGVSQPVQLRGARMSAHGFDIFGVQAAQGRTFAADEDQPGKHLVAVITHALWQSQFGGASDIVGKIIQLDGEPHTVIGVLPAGSAFDRSFAQIYRPLVFEPQNLTRNFHWFGAFGLLKPGVSLASARAEMDAIAARIAAEFPDSNKGWGVAVDPLAETIVGTQLRRSLYVLLAAVGMVLLIACANLANLTLTRSAARDREVAIRASVGADRWRLIRQFLTESIVLSLAGGLLGVLLGYGLMIGLKAAVPPFSLPSEAVIRMDVRALAFAVLVSVLTGLIFGLAPALQATHPNLSVCMKEGGRGSGTGSGKHRLRRALVVSEVALAFLLLTGSGLLIRSFFQMQNVDAGFRHENVITAGLPLSDKRYATPQRLNEYLRQVVESVQTLPGVADVAITSALPMQGWGYGMPFQRADKPIVDRANRKPCFFKMVSPSYFRALGIDLRQGRGLADRDSKGAPPVTVVNETMVRMYFPNGENPIGKRLLVQEIVPGKTQLGPEIPWEIVGVIRDEKVGNVDDSRDNPGMYVSYEQSPVYSTSLVVRGIAGMDVRTMQQAIAAAVRQIDKDQALSDVRTMEQIRTETMAANRLNSLMLGGFATVALLLSAIGIYGVISFSVVQRTQEIGIRSALGATTGSLLVLILRSGLVLTLAGLLIGLLGSLALNHLLTAMLFGITPRDPVTLFAAALVLAVVSLLASYLPARRATRVHPMTCLRYE